MCETGKNPTLRHLGRTHRVDLAWMFEQFQREVYDLRYCTSEEQAADIFTKHFVLADKWKQVTQLIGHMDVEELFQTKLKKSAAKSKGQGPWVLTPA